jgi:PTS system nitrogen regulatory IIA component
LKLRELLTEGRVAIAKRNGSGPLSKAEILREVSRLLANGAPLAATEIHKVLEEREALQSTGIGEGVAIPHGSLPELDHQIGAVLTVPGGVDFDSIDNADVQLVVALVSPKRESGEHLKTLARISRILRSRAFRDRLVGAHDAKEVYDLLLAEDGA